MKDEETEEMNDDQRVPNHNSNELTTPTLSIVNGFYYDYMAKTGMQMVVVMVIMGGGG